MSRLRFAGPFAFLFAIPLMYLKSSAGPCLVPLALLTALLAMSYVPLRNRRPEQPKAGRALPGFYILLQLCAIVWGALEAGRGEGGATGVFSLAVSVGICGGVFGVLCAHAMIHSRTRWHRPLALLMLTGIGYRHFRIAHLHGHHRFAATLRDPSTARLGESFYSFFVRSVVSQWVLAWRFERERVRARRLPMGHNRMLQDLLIVSALYAGLLGCLGGKAVAFLALESMVAVIVLELFNYVAHYGLMRGQGEALAEHHSWNSAGAANLLIFNMGHHSAHHQNPSAAYPKLQPAQQRYILPGGYAGAILLALVPSLWRKVIHPRLSAAGASLCNSGYAPLPIPAATPP